MAFRRAEASISGQMVPSQADTGGRPLLSRGGNSVGVPKAAVVVDVWLSSLPLSPLGLLLLWFPLF